VTVLEPYEGKNKKLQTQLLKKILTQKNKKRYLVRELGFFFNTLSNFLCTICKKRWKPGNLATTLKQLDVASKKPSCISFSFNEPKCPNCERIVTELKGYHVQVSLCLDGCPQ
jgi:hypothetical protein